EHEVRFTNLKQRDKEKTNLIAKLDDDIRKIKQEQNVNILAQSNTFIPKSPIHSISSQSSISPNIEGISKQSNYSGHSIEKNNADPISQDFNSIPLDQTNISSVVDHSCLEKNVEKLCLKKGDKQNTLSHQKILYREKVKRGLRQELSSFCSKDSNGRVFNIQIPEFSLEAILTGSSKITAQTIVDLFNVAMKVRHKEILCWYCYYKSVRRSN
ncbi:9221_t:CDS:2, partial [Funneliformis mosseae]